MLGLLFPFAGIALGGIIGVVLRKWINAYCDALMCVVGLCVVYLGLDMALGSEDFLGILMCMFIGTLIGELMHLDNGAKHVGDFLEKKLSRGGESGSFSKAFVTCSVLFALGPLPLLGPIEAATGLGWGSLLNQTAMDSVSTVIFGAAMGIGAAFSAFTILIFETIIFLCAGLIAPILTPDVLTEIYAVGGIIVAAAGLSMVLKDFNPRVTNMIPALFLALAYKLIL